MKYFCDCCGARFEADPKPISEFLMEDVRCPACGVFDVYEDTAEGATESVRALSDYENKINEWEDDE